MKLYHDLKKQPVRALSSNWGILLIVFSFAAFGSFSFAATVEELQNKISQKDADITVLEAEIASFQGELNSLDKQKNSLNRSIKELDLTRKKLVADIAVTGKKIDKKNLEIEELSSDIGGKESSIKTNIDSIELEIRNTNEFEQTGMLETLLSQNDFSMIWNDIDNIATVREKLIENIAELREIKGELENTRKKTVSAKAELVALKSKLADQQKIIIQNTNEKNQLLKQTKSSETAYQKLLKERQAQVLAFEKELRDYESQLKFILDPSKLPSAGVLSWPLEKIYVTQLFGKTADSKRLYASGSHSGVDFRASVGTQVMSMADGVVAGSGNTDATCVGTSFGKWILIKYDNGLASVFGHLSLIKASEGQKVKRGEVVAYSGNTGHTTGPHLHVSVYAATAVNVEKRPSTACKGKVYTMPISPINAYLDPMFYLPKLPK